MPLGSTAIVGERRDEESGMVFRVFIYLFLRLSLVPLN